MTSDATVDRFYYIFDSREHRALVLDRTTGQEVAWTSVPRAQLIEHVGEQRSSAVLRRFARWCARRVEVETAQPSAPAGRLWEAAQTDDEKAWRQARTEATDAVVRAAALGLPRRNDKAAQLLVAHACTHPDPARAAIDAAHMSERWAEFTADPDPERAVRVMRQHHVDWLLDALNEK